MSFRGRAPVNNTTTGSANTSANVSADLIHLSLQKSKRDQELRTARAENEVLRQYANASVYPSRGSPDANERVASLQEMLIKERQTYAERLEMLAGQVEALKGEVAMGGRDTVLRNHAEQLQGELIAANQAIAALRQEVHHLRATNEGLNGALHRANMAVHETQQRAAAAAASAAAAAKSGGDGSPRREERSREGDLQASPEVRDVEMKLLKRASELQWENDELRRKLRFEQSAHQSDVQAFTQMLEVEGQHGGTDKERQLTRKLSEVTKQLAATQKKRNEDAHTINRQNAELAALTEALEVQARERRTLEVQQDALVDELEGVQSALAAATAATAGDEDGSDGGEGSSGGSRRSGRKTGRGGDYYNPQQQQQQPPPPGYPQYPGVMGPMGYGPPQFGGPRPYGQGPGRPPFQRPYATIGGGYGDRRGSVGGGIDLNSTYHSVAPVYR